MTTWSPDLAPGRSWSRTSSSGRRALVDARVRTGAAAILWLGMLLPTYWWAADGGLRGLDSAAVALVSLGRLSGLIASVLLLAQVMLMARVPVLEHAFGQDRLARIHRIVGFTSFNVMVVHGAAISLGYAGASFGELPSTVWHLAVDYPGMLLAVAGTGALVMVVVTSAKAARKRLRYESWHLMHLYAYLGVGLALPHQLWTGQQFLSSPGRTLFWWTAWAVSAGAVLWWRLAVPVARNLRHRLRVSSVVREDDGIVSVYVTGQRLDRLRVEAGQFFSWRFLGAPGRSRAHPYSLSAAPDGRSLRITVQADGDDSATLSRARPGTAVLVEGPFGRLSDRSRTKRKVALIGSGVGITPLRALAEALDYGPGQAVLLHRHRERPLFGKEFEVLARERGLGLIGLPGRRRYQGSWLGSGIHPQVDDRSALLQWIPDIAERDVYVCGPPGWAALVEQTVRSAGLRPDQLHLETFTW
ncbi:MAG: ferredoxin reductase family protein [Marmoricola sp.]